jgi:DNA modification methylase
VKYDAIYHGDARELGKGIKDRSVDLIFTDPPYPKEYLYLYEWLAEFAARVLKPDGFLLTYAGVYWKNIVYRMMDEHLDYFFDYVEYNKGNSTILWPRKTISRYKSILCYRPRAGIGMPVTNAIGVYVDGMARKGGDKRYHKWGQVEGTARYFIEVFTKEDTLVVDPFLGGGTTAMVCKRLRRKYIGFEIDSVAYDTSVNRLAGVPVPNQVIQEEMFA